jgi:integrase/recombinase XerC
MQAQDAGMRVELSGAGHRLAGGGSCDDVALVNRFLDHLAARCFSAATIRAYAYDLLNFLRFVTGRGSVLASVVPADLFDYLEWQSRPRPGPSGGVVVRMDRRRGAAPATMNRRIAAVRGLFEYAVITGLRAESPVPAARRSSGLRAARRGMLGHLDRPGHRGGRLVREQRRLPEALEPAEVEAFTAGLSTSRDRAMVLLMLLGGLRAAEVRGLRLADVDMGLRRVRVVGKGGRERIVPVDGAFFAELAAYLRLERPRGLATAECFVMLRGPTAGQPMTEAGMRRIFRTHRGSPGAGRVRPHRLRHTYGTGLEIGGVASDATFPGRRERPWPALRRWNPAASRPGLTAKWPVTCDGITWLHQLVR